MLTFATPMPARRPRIGHAHRSWTGDRPAIFRTSRDTFRDCNIQWVWRSLLHHDQQHGGTAYVMHWPEPRRNNYRFILEHGRVRKMTRREVNRKIRYWTAAQVARWRRGPRASSERPMTYAAMTRIARSRGKVICAELKHYAFTLPWVARQLVTSARRANHPAWFTRLYHLGHVDQVAAAVRSADGFLAVIFGTFQHERAAYAVRRRAWPVQPSATW